MKSILVVFLLFSVSSAKAMRAPTLSARCKQTVLSAARKALVVENKVFFTEITPSNKEINIYDVGFADNTDMDQCFYRVIIQIKPLKFDQIKNQVSDCSVLAAEDDGEPNCG